MNIIFYWSLVNFEEVYVMAGIELTLKELISK